MGSFWYFNLYVIVLELIIVPFICNSVWQYVHMYVFKVIIQNINICNTILLEMIIFLLFCGSNCNILERKLSVDL